MRDTSPTTVACPICSKKVAWNDASKWRPFCSERCKLIDLGDWADESHRISGEELSNQISDDEFNYPN